MKYIDFLLQTSQEQYEIVAAKSILISSFTSFPYKYFLYQLDNFYIESKINMETNKLEQLLSFAPGAESLDKYLTKIDIKSIF